MVYLAMEKLNREAMSQCSVRGARLRLRRLRDCFGLCSEAEWTRPPASKVIGRPKNPAASKRMAALYSLVDSDEMAPQTHVDCAWNSSQTMRLRLWSTFVAQAERQHESLRTSIRIRLAESSWALVVVGVEDGFQCVRISLKQAQHPQQPSTQFSQDPHASPSRSARSIRRGACKSWTRARRSWLGEAPQGHRRRE